MSILKNAATGGRKRRHPFARAIAATAVAALTGTGLAACGSNPSGDADAADEVVLTITSHQWLERGRGDAMSDLFKSLADDMPGVRIETKGIPFDSIKDTLLTQLRAGDGPDMFLMSASYMPSLAAGDYLQPLDELVPAADIGGLRAINDAGRYDGAQLAYLSEVATYGFAYNVDLLKEAGVGIPTNWDEFLAAAEAVKQNTDGFGFAAAHQAAEQGAWHHDFKTFVASFGGALSDGENITLDRPENVEALEAYKALYDTMPVGTKNPDRQAMFGEGLIAIYLTNSPSLGHILGEAGAGDFELAVGHPLPEVGVVAPKQWVGINKKTEHTEAAAEIMKKFLERDFQEKWIELMAGGTTAVDVDVPSSLTDKWAWIEDWVAMTNDDQLLEPFIEGFGDQTPLILTPLFEELEQVMAADLDPAKALSNAQARAEKALAK